MASGPDFPEVSDCVGMTVLVRPADLHTFHRNPRRGDVDAIAASLKENGQFKPIVVNVGTHTGRPNEVLAGNHTLMAFRQLREQNPFDAYYSGIKAHILDVDDDMANRIVLADNQTHELGEGTDDEVVYELLSKIGTTGTGYEDTDLDALEAALGKQSSDPDPDDDDDGKPDLPHKEPSAIGFTLVFDDEEQQDVWFAWVKKLREDYPDPDMTVAERLLAHLSDRAGQRA